MEQKEAKGEIEYDLIRENGKQGLKGDRIGGRGSRLHNI
jgi:hypothetical protein